MLWKILVQFIFRMSFGIATAMAMTPSRSVTSGFYRIHLWVLLGLNTLAGLAVYSQRQGFDERRSWLTALAVSAVILSYVGSVCWLYERPRSGTIVLYLLAALSLATAGLATDWKSVAGGWGHFLQCGDLVAGGLLLGSTMTAMFLGHWYLNTPSMQLEPLKKLVKLMMVAVVVRAVFSALGLAFELGHGGALEGVTTAFLALRWLSGLLGALVLAVMTWETLKVPNTQSATGILYVGVICVFLGELAAMLLSADTWYPL